MKPFTMKKYLYILSILCTLLCSTCSYDDIVPENPCNGVKYTKAEIKIEENVGSRWFEGDTIAELNSCRFTSMQDADEYTWYIGSEVLKTKSFVRKYFPSGWLDVSLVVRRKANKVCSPSDDGIDSTYKKFFVWPDYKDINNGEPFAPYYPVYGTYKGYRNSNPNKEVIVTILDTFWTDDIGKSAYIEIISNIPYDNRSTLGQGRVDRAGYFIDYSPKVMHFTFSSGGLGAEVDGKLISWLPGVDGYAIMDRQNTNKIKIEYNYNDTFNRQFPLPFSDVFYGIRIY